MTVDLRLLDILCCPTSRQPLQRADGILLERLKAAAASGGLRQADGSTLATAPREALVTRDGKLVYRVDDGIPVLLAEESIDASQLPAAGSG
jgi:uncharacterized protein YbaR (Trm112 family)